VRSNLTIGMNVNRAYALDTTKSITSSIEEEKNDGPYDHNASGQGLQRH